MSESERNSSAPDFTPLGTSASLRMLGSVMGRLQGGSASSANRPAKGESPSMPVASQAERVVADEKSAAPSRGFDSSLPQLQVAWTPPVSRMAMQLQEQRESTAPLWSTLPKADLKPVVSAVEADLHSYLEHQSAGRSRPDMPVLAGQSGDESAGGSRNGSSSLAQRAAMDASTRLLDAVRAQAASQAIASDNRISLGDLTLIAFADSKKQMAAAAAHAEHTPDTHPLKKAIDNSANKKFMEDRKGFETKLKKVAELALDSLEKCKRIAKERFGSHG